MFAITRRALLSGVAAASFAPAISIAGPLPMIVVNKDPSCGCCAGWVEHLRGAGFQARVIEAKNMQSVKTRLGVPAALESCHTAEIDGYVIEGHVPAQAIRRLLAERPAARGLAVPGMPAGSPGMEVPGAADETYEVILFTRSGQKVFSRFKGAKELA